MAMATAPPQRRAARRQVSTGYRTVTLTATAAAISRSRRGSTAGTIDFMVDTGASMIALRESAAARLGIIPRPRDYTGRTQTANGVGKAAPVRLDRVEVNGITVRDVEAVVMPDEALSVNLLGMSFLSRVKWTHDRGRLVLEQ